MGKNSHCRKHDLITAFCLYSVHATQLSFAINSLQICLITISRNGGRKYTLTKKKKQQKILSRWKWILFTWGRNGWIYQSEDLKMIKSSLCCRMGFSLLCWLSKLCPRVIPTTQVGPVFNLLLFFELCPTHLPRFSLLHFPSFPHALHLSFLPAPSSHHPPSSPLFFFSFLWTYRLSDCLLMPSFSTSPLISSPLLLLLTPCCRPACCYAACSHASPWPPCLHPLLNYSWESSPVSGGLCREERRRVQRQ